MIIKISHVPITQLELMANLVSSKLHRLPYCHWSILKEIPDTKHFICK